MRRAGSVFLILFLLLGTATGFGAAKVTPTTTLAAETGNNTSAANSFQAQKNGNSAAGNVSKVDTRELLYSGSKTAIYAHYMPWFGKASHMNVGYSTTDPAQAARQVDDMMSRGIQGIVVDWYGRNFAQEEQSTETIFTEVQKHSDFKFAIMEDSNALKGDKTADLIADLIYAAQKYQKSPNYLRWNDRPVVFFFGVESLSIDWNSVRDQVPGNPIFIFENAGGLSFSFSNGAFGWANGFNSDRATNWGEAYLASYYKSAVKSDRYSVGSTWKGFNDSLANWSANRVLGQNCGQTWLNTFAEIGKHYSADNQLSTLQLVTWNDYEEGTAMEVGIDNCVSVSGAISGNTLSWTITGNENTIHHYSVFISTDGAQLMPVADVPAGTHKLELENFNFENGAYNIYVKAVGQPSIRNQMSSVIGWSNSSASETGSVTQSAADFQLSAAPMVWRPSRSGGTSAGASVTLTPRGTFNASVALSCSGLPADVSCTFDQNNVTLGAQPVVAQVTLMSKKQAAALAPTQDVTFAFCFPGLSLGMLVLRTRRSRRTIAMALVALAFVLMTTGCVSVVQSAPKVEAPAQATSQTVTFNIVAQAGTLQRTTSATVILQ